MRIIGGGGLEMARYINNWGGVGIIGWWGVLVERENSPFLGKHVSVMYLCA